MKVDKLVNDLFKKFNNITNGNGHSNTNNQIINDDDYDYYLSIGEEPPRFAYYRHYRIQNSKDEWRKKTLEAAYDSITQDELDFNLKRKLRISPEQRYQQKKENWLFHDSSYYARGLEAYDGFGCNQFTDCVPECRFYPEYGRIEDQEVIDEHNKRVECLKQKDAIVEPPTEDELSIETG